jgi:Ca-activated chloride channel family protein
MDLLWPGFLLLLGLVPVLIGVYVWNLRRSRRFVVRYSSLAWVREALPPQSRMKRHLPFALFLLALASLVFALSRPVTVVSVPTDQTTIILAMDVSRSMCSMDIHPNRLKAAEAAALSFVRRQKSTTRIGIVAFGSFAELVQSTTTDQEALANAIESLALGRRTAIGSGILKSLDAIAEVDHTVAPSKNQFSNGPDPTPVPKGAYVPDIIVLLTDGVSNVGPMPVEAAQQAADRGVRIYTIGFGTLNGDPSGSFPSCEDQFQGGNLFGGGGSLFGGNSQLGLWHRGIDEATLKKVSEMTGGKYYSATSAGELQQVFRSLPTSMITMHETTEISVAFTAIGAVLAGLAILLSLIWHPLP